MVWLGVWSPPVPSSLGVEVLLGYDIIDPLIAAKLFLFNPGDAGTMSAATAVALLLLAGATLARERAQAERSDGGHGPRHRALALLGYAYGVRDLYDVPLFTAMAFHTAAAIFVLAHRPSGHSPGNRLGGHHRLPARGRPRRAAPARLHARAAGGGLHPARHHEGPSPRPRRGDGRARRDHRRAPVAADPARGPHA